jgi:hypothetical protein
MSSSSATEVVSTAASARSATTATSRVCIVYSPKEHERWHKDQNEQVLHGIDSVEW